MFGVLLSNELNKEAACKKPKGPVMKTDTMKKIAQLLDTVGAGSKPQPVTPAGGYQPKPITPGVGGITPPPTPVTPPKTETPFAMNAQSNFNPGYNKMASQESTMNMFGVLVNMELQKLAYTVAPGDTEEDSGLPGLSVMPKKKKPTLENDVNEALDRARKAKKKLQY